MACLSHFWISVKAQRTLNWPSFQDTYWLYTQMITLSVLTLSIGKLTNLFSVKWKIIICLAICGLLYFISWFSSYGFTKYWNCILTRNHDITEQLMNLEKKILLIRWRRQFHSLKGNKKNFIAFLRIFRNNVITVSYTTRLGSWHVLNYLSWCWQVLFSLPLRVCHFWLWTFPVI